MSRRGAPIVVPDDAPIRGEWGNPDWTGPRGFEYARFGRAELMGVWSREIRRPDRPGHFFEDRPDGRADLPPTEVIVHPVELPDPALMTVREVGVEVRRPIITERAVAVSRPAPPVVVERRPRVAVAAQERRFTQPMEVEIEYREHIRYPDGHVEHSRPRFEHVDRERYLANHPEGYVAGGSSAYVAGGSSAYVAGGSSGAYVSGGSYGGSVRGDGPIVVAGERRQAPIVVEGDSRSIAGSRRPIVA